MHTVSSDNFHSEILDRHNQDRLGCSIHGKVKIFVVYLFQNASDQSTK